MTHEAFTKWWGGLSHQEKRVLIGYGHIKTTVFDELPKNIQDATINHWEYWYK